MQFQWPTFSSAQGHALLAVLVDWVGCEGGQGRAPPPQGLTPLPLPRSALSGWSKHLSSPRTVDPRGCRAGHPCSLVLMGNLKSALLGLHPAIFLLSQQLDSSFKVVYGFTYLLKIQGGRLYM